MKKILQGFLIGLLLFSAIPVLADVTVGLPADSGTGNCFPFGCSYNAEYQQVYLSSQFSGPITITNLEFFNTQYNSGATAMNSGNPGDFQIALSTTSANPNSLPNSSYLVLGSDNTTVFDGDLGQSWTFGNTLSIILSTPFTYDPTQGNLLMDVVGRSITSPGGSIFFDVNSSTSVTGRIFASNGVSTSSPSPSNGYGLVTGFSTSTNTSVPEPTTMLFLGLGLLGLAGVRRKIKK